jgi:alpha-amylase
MPYLKKLPEMKNICLYFQIHHPFSFRRLRFFDIGESKAWYDDSRILSEIHDAAANYYLPTNNFLLRLIHQTKENLKVSFYISGTSLDQFLMYTPKVIRSFRQLADTGQVEFIGGTASHSIASLACKKEEFKRQIKLNRERIKQYFGQNPRVFVNTDLLYTNQIGKVLSESGYQTVLTNGIKKILQWRGSNYVYSGQDQSNLRVLFRNDGISNEFSSLLGNPNYLEKPEQMEPLFALLDTLQQDEPVVNIYLNYKTIGGFGQEAKQQYFRAFVLKIMNDQSFRFSLPSALVEHSSPIAEIGSDEPVCWAEHFHSSWYPGNELQKEALRQLFKYEKQACCSENPSLQKDWQYLQTADHFHLMDKNHPDYEGSSSSQNTYKSNYDAFINYMNILEDFRIRLKNEESRQKTYMSLKHPFLPCIIEKPYSGHFFENSGINAQTI